MRSGHWFRLRRASLPKPDGKKYNRKDREEFTLPVLERLKPKSRCTEILGESERGLPVFSPFLVVMLAAPDQMANKRHEEQREQSK